LTHAFAATGRRHAADSALRVRTGVESFGASWIAEREAACARLDLDPRADGRLACLDTRKDEMAAALAVLAVATPEAVDHAVETIGALPSPRRCASPELPAPPPELAASLTRVRRGIARANALQRAARYDEALTEIQRAQQAAVALDHAPAIAEAALTHSTILQGLGAYADGRAQSEYAYFTAQAEGHDELTFQAAWKLALSTRLVGGADAEAQAWARRAEATLQRLGDDADRKLPGVLEYMFAALALQTGDYVPAIEHGRQATAILERELGTADHRVTATMVATATALAQLHRLDEAEAEAQRAIASAEAAVGPDHPFTADAMILLAIVLQQRNEFEEALAIHRRVLEIQLASLDPQSPALATTWMNIGNVEAELGNADASESALRRALEITRASVGGDNAASVPILHDLALTLSARGERDEAIAAWREAIEIGRRQLGPDHPHVGDALASLGEALADAGRVDEGVPMIEQALAIRRATLGDGDPIVADALRALARAQRLGGELEQAQRSVDQAR
jgi:tetratricopeptide (TPR) repeat protein